MRLKPLEASFSSINTVTGCILGGLWRPTKATLPCSLFAFLKQSQGEAGWSLPGHSLLCKHDSAAAVWGNHPVAARSHPGQQTWVWTAGDQFKEVRELMLALWWSAEFRESNLHNQKKSHHILMISDLQWGSWRVRHCLHQTNMWTQQRRLLTGGNRLCFISAFLWCCDDYL